MRINAVGCRREDYRAQVLAIGTTLRGIGPGYEDKAARRGIRIADLLDRAWFPDALAQLIADHRTRARAFGLDEEIDVDAVSERYTQAAERIRPLVCDTVRLLHDAMAAGKNLLFEGCRVRCSIWTTGAIRRDVVQRFGGWGLHGRGHTADEAIDGVIGISKA